MKTPKTKSTRLVLPRAEAGSTDEPANADAGTLSFDDATDTVRIKEAAGWADLSGGGGGGITSIVAGTGISVTNPTGPAVTIDATGSPPLAHATTHQNGGSDEINVAGLNGQLADPQPSTPTLAGSISAANTGISALTGKTVPVAADTLALNDSAASNALKKATLGDVAAAVITITNPNPRTRKPPTPYALDDEFEIVPGGALATAELALRGWIFWDQGGNTVMIYDGAVIFGGSPPPVGHYRASIFGSEIFIQLPTAVASREYRLYKTLGWASGNSLAVWAKVGNWGAPSANLGNMNVFYAASVSVGGTPRPDTANRRYSETLWNSQVQQLGYQRVTAAAFTGGTITGGGEDILWVSQGTVGNATEGRHIFASSQGGSYRQAINSTTSWTPVYAGVGFFAQSISIGVDVYLLDFVRFDVSATNPSFKWFVN